MKLKHISLSLSAAATTLATLTAMTGAASANPFTVNGTYGSWNNAQLTNGTVVGKDATNSAFANYEQAASGSRHDNYVEFFENNGVSQVRWGDGAYSNYDAAKMQDGGNDYVWDYGYHRKDGSLRRGWHKDYTAQKSGLGFAGITNQTLDVGQVLNLGTLKHYNNTIWGMSSEQKAGESVEFSLGLDLAEVGLQTFDFSLSIDETRNDAGYHAGGVCPYQTDDGKGCSDRISWDFTVDQDSSFNYQGSEYTLELVGFSDSIDNIDGFTTSFISQESGTSESNLWARLVKVPEVGSGVNSGIRKVPEPGSLLGLATVAAGLVGARRKKKQA